MKIAGPNILRSERGLLKASELRVGDSLLGYDAGRDLAWATMVDIRIHTDPEPSYLIVGTSGEAVLTSQNEVFTMSGRSKVRTLAPRFLEEDIKIERLGATPASENNDGCVANGCVERMCDLLRWEGIDVGETILRNIGEVPDEALPLLTIRRSAISEGCAYVRPKNAHRTASALLHGGPCLGLRVIDGVSVVAETMSTCVFGRQAIELHAKINDRPITLRADPRFGPRGVLILWPDKSARVDRIESVSHFGLSKVYTLRFQERSFKPILGSMPIAG